MNNIIRLKLIQENPSNELTEGSKILLRFVIASLEDQEAKQLTIHNVIVPLCENLDSNNKCKNMCLTRCVEEGVL